MYSALPPNTRRLIKGVLAAAWLWAGGAGLSASIMAPGTYVAELGSVWTVVFGVSLSASAIIAAIGVVMARYRWEWIAAWAAAASIAPYLVTVWALTFTDTWTRSTQAFLVTSLLTFFVLRAILCAAHAAQLRKVHEASTAAMDAVVSEGGGNADDTAGGG